MNQMDIIQIQHLLAKYFEGNTTLDEESVLLNYFSEDEAVDIQLKPLKKQFDMIRAGKSAIPFDYAALESKILDRIEKIENQKPSHVRNLGFSRFMIAASIALIVGISGLLIYNAQNRASKDTFSDPRLAYLETQRTLLYISNKMNKGIEPLSNISKINTGTEELRNLGKIDKSLGMLNLVSFVNKSSNLKK
jgi:hypothetical protein